MNRHHVSFAIAAAAACLVPHGRADAGVPLPRPVPQVSVRIGVEGDSVVAKDAAGVELWRVRHASVKWIEPRQGQPVAFGRHMYYGHHCYLMVLDPAAGRVVLRVAYPGRISSIEPREASLAVFVEVVIDRERKLTVRKEFAFDPQRPATPALPIDGETAVPAPMLDAHRLLQGFDIERKPAGAELAVARGVYDHAFAANPTNPWFMFDKGVLLRHLGRREEARAAFRALVAAESAPAFDFLRISALLAMMGEMSESDLAFERGYGELVRSGVQPELVLSREAFVRLYAMPMPAAPSVSSPSGPSAGPSAKGSPPPGGRTAHAAAVAAAQEAGDVDCMARLTERVWRLAPGCPGATSAFAGLAEHLQKNGRASEASIWFARAREAARLEGPVGVRQAFDAGVACFAALGLLLLVVFAKTFSRQRKELAPLGGWLRSWRWPKERFCKMAFSYATRKELFGILLMAAAGFGFSYLAVRSERTRLGGLPEEVSSGAWSHPRVLDLFDKLESESGKLLYGIARHQEGAGSAAAEIYKPLARSDDADIAAIAENNLGVIRSRPEHFKRALELRPGMAEAGYNLGEPVDSVRVNRARRYTPGGKLIALPTGPILAAALAESPVKIRDAGPAEGVLGVHGWILVWLALVVTALVGPLTLPFMAIRNEAESPRARRPLAGLGYVVPGTSGRLAPIGGFILAGWIYCLIVFVSLLRREYAGGPDLPTQIREVFGTAGSMVFWFETALSVFAPVAFIGLWILNGILLARAGRVAGEAAPPAAKAPPAGPEAGKPEVKKVKGKEDKAGDVKAREVKPKEVKAKEAKEVEAKKVETKKPKEAKPDAAEPKPREAEAEKSKPREAHADEPKAAAPPSPPETRDKKEAEKTETEGEEKARERDGTKDETKDEKKDKKITGEGPHAKPDGKPEAEAKTEKEPDRAAPEKKPEGGASS